MKFPHALSFFVLLTLIGVTCGDSDSSPAASATPPGVELPVSTVELGPLDAALATRGQQIFETRCTTCHKLDTRYVGPPLGDIIEQREPAYIMNMILAPEKMLQVDATAKEVLAEYNVPMTNQNLTHDEARALLEYFRQLHNK